MDERLCRIVAGALGAQPQAWHAAARGYTNNERWIVSLATGRRAFVKAAHDELGAGWLRDEHRIYSSVTGAFLPRLLGWDDDGERPVLVLEDLSEAFWPPPWTIERVEAVLAALADVAATQAPAGLPLLEQQRSDLAGWSVVAADRRPLLGLGLCSSAWLEYALPRLQGAEEACDLEGRGLLHLDVRSDNICFRAGRAILVDWNHAVVGNPVVDVAGWLPSLRAEGGPCPEAILPDAPEAAAFISGYFAARAGLPPPSTAPRVRDVQVAQLRVALPWAARALGLSPPNG